MSAPNERPMSDAPLLEIKGLGKRFPGRPHVHLHDRLRDIDANKDLFHVPSL